MKLRSITYNQTSIASAYILTEMIASVFIKRNASLFGSVTNSVKHTQPNPTRPYYFFNWAKLTLNHSKQNTPLLFSKETALYATCDLGFLVYWSSFILRPYQGLVLSKKSLVQGLFSYTHYQRPSQHIKTNKEHRLLSIAPTHVAISKRYLSIVKSSVEIWKRHLSAEQNHTEKSKKHLTIPQSHKETG